MTDSSQIIPPHESDASEAVNRSPSSRGGSQRGAAANNGYRRRAERNQRGGFNQQHHRSNYYPTPLVGPHTEFYTPPRAVFDLPPQFLPPHMFNANVVPVSERDANFELQFGNYSRNVPYINNDGLFIPPQQQLQPQEFIPSEQQPEEVYANGLESQLGQLFIPTQQQRQPQEFIPSEQPSQEVYTNGLESQLEQLNVGGNEGHQLATALDVPSRHRQKSPRSTDRSKNASHSNATQSNRRHVNAQNRKSRGGSGLSSSKRGNQRGRGAAAMERQLQRPAYNDLESFPLADSSEEGYGCPPSYLLETYRDETDRQQMAAAEAAASALLPSRGRRNGTQIFPGRRRGHSNQPSNQFSGIYQVSNEQIQRRNERKDDDGNLDTLRGRVQLNHSQFRMGYEMALNILFLNISVQLYIVR
ncbi:unnamed protein product [Anisakis simplex]|uniref:Uncharacterized protein n=1 Tax=Anisakis simplex TaxID=6269 RepID=A0A0M3KAI6_ANISI|nr:unnamed protein product [Anisakis simplex]